MNTRPSAFLCHSSADKELVTKLATDLRANGVDAWLDKWRIQPGESLCRKIDEGIAAATHFFAILTPNSITSEWVQTELDAAMVEKIQGNTILVPVLHGLEDCNVPPTLRGVRWVRIDEYASGLRELMNVCHNVSEEPPLQEGPRRHTVVVPETLELSRDAYRVAALVCSQSRDGYPLDRIFSFADICDQEDLSEDELLMACDELQDRGFINDQHVRSGRVVAEWRLFFELDLHIKGWSADNDALRVAIEAVNERAEAILLSDLSSRLGWEPRRLNPACAFLERTGLARVDKVLGTAPFYYRAVRKTPKTMRFARDST